MRQGVGAIDQARSKLHLKSSSVDLLLPTHPHYVVPAPSLSGVGTDRCESIDWTPIRTGQLPLTPPQTLALQLPPALSFRAEARSGSASRPAARTPNISETFFGPRRRSRRRASRCSTLRPR